MSLFKTKKDKLINSLDSFSWIKRKPFVGFILLIVLLNVVAALIWPVKFPTGFYSIGNIAYYLAQNIIKSSLNFFYWGPAIVLLMLLMVLAFSSQNQHKLKNHRKFIDSDKVFLFLTALFIILLRWPMLCFMDNNPDESTAISGAMTLVSDPVFWRSVDAGSQGPIVHYLLLLPKLLLMRIDFGAAKFVGLGVNVFTTLLFFSFFKNVFGQKLARISVLPLAVSLGLITQSDFIAYNSELVVLLFITLSLYLVTKLLDKKNEKISGIVVLLGIVLGCIPFVKLQGVPMALVIALSAYLVLIYRLKNGTNKNRLLPFTLLTFGGLFPLLVCLIVLSMTGTFGYFWDNYILGNLAYSSRNDTGLMLSKFMRFGHFSLFLQNYLGPSEQGFYQVSDFFRVTGGLFVVSLIIHLIGWKHLKLKNLLFLLFAIVIGAASFYSIAQPGNLFPHYLILLFVPFTLACGIIFGNSSELLKNQRLCSAGQIIFFIALVIHPFQNQLLNGKSLLTYIEPSEIVEDNPLVKKIQRYASPGEKMIIWGWANKYYVLTGLIQGSRFGSTVLLIQPQFIPSMSHKKKENLEMLLNDFEASKAPIFLDAVGVGNFAFQNRPSQGHEISRELTDYVRQQYQLVDDIYGTRIYVRKDRLLQVENNPQAKDPI
jgi:hypothetical protein